MYYKDRNNKEIASLNPVFQGAINPAMAEAEASGLNILITEGYRTFERSDALFDDPNVYAVPGGWSMHNFKVAFDCVPVRSDGSVNYGDHKTYKAFAKICKKYGMTWGGDWKVLDKPHFEYTQGHGIEHFRAGGKLSYNELRKPRPAIVRWYPSIPQQIATVRRALDRKQRPERRRLLERKLERLLRRLE